MAHSSSGPARSRSRSPAPQEKPLKPLTGADPDKRKRLLAAAIRVFGERGFHEARIAEIASEAGVAEGTVYLYFHNKEDLLGVVFDETMDEVLAEGRRLDAEDLPASERLAKMVGLHIDFLSGDRHLASVFQIELRRSARLVERFSRSKLVEYFRLLESVIRDGQKRGEFRSNLNPRLAVRIIFGGADEILSEWLILGEAKPAASGRQLIDTLVPGFENRETVKEKKPRQRSRGKGESS
ncbi:MAG: HTH-type transcriptional regulator BetI [Thermoanaerobaculia bacterium]|nr:HTH-type transcriptional regulator BetI [Thermoanaerobaculia bacterium]